MTMLVAWIGIDTHGHSSAYIASDSRYSWGNMDHFDYGRKVFACKGSPEIFGYVGDVLFPSTVLAQIVALIDQGLLINKEMNADERNHVVFNKIVQTTKAYPSLPQSSFSFEIIHISREDGDDKYPVFRAYRLSYSAEKGFSSAHLPIPNCSGLLCVKGSGTRAFYENYERFKRGKNANTSRNVFHCFCDTLYSMSSSTVGGSPQLVGLYRKKESAGIEFGILYRGKRYFLGMCVAKGAILNTAEWRNERFELCNGKSTHKQMKAAAQPLDKPNLATP